MDNVSQMNDEAWKLRVNARWQPRQVLDNPWVSWGMGAGLLAAGALARSPRRKLELLTTASRRLEGPLLQALGRRLLAPWLKPEAAEIWRREKIGWGRYYGDVADIREKALTTSLLLKEPGPAGEKGVLYASFEFNWMRLLANHDARRFLNDYHLVGASSWSPSDHAVLAGLNGLSADPVFVGISNLSDLAQYRMFEPGLRALPLLACDWVDPADFAPKPRAEREIDIVMVSHFSSWKRHWLLFEALRHMPRDLNVVLIGRNSPGRDARTLRDEARAFGVPQDLTILNNLEIAEVARHQCNAKVALALSKREGSCVSVTEALMADTPVGMMDDAHVGARAYINDRTGRILHRRGMASQLREMLERAGDYAPRQWARANISAPVSSIKLNAILKRHSLETGRPWTRDIAPLCWRYVPRYLHEADKARLAPGVARLKEEYGIELEEFVSEREALRRQERRRVPEKTSAAPVHGSGAPLETPGRP